MKWQADDAVFSRYDGDPDLHELVEMFVAEMPARMAALETAFASGVMEDVRTVAHQLKGAAGSYGFDSVTPLAANVESTINSGASIDEIRAELDALIGTCERIRCTSAS